MQSSAAALADKSILITGGSMGIGLETARTCLNGGARVLICARGADSLAAAEAELRARPGSPEVASAIADVGREADVDALFATFEARFGRCHGVIHAAGVYGPIGTIADIAPDQWWDALRINLFGSFLVARAAARAMRARGGGRIVLMSGGGAATPFANYTAYASSKVAVVRLTETIAQELAPDIEVNCLGPGFVATRLHEQTLAAGVSGAGSFFDKTRSELAAGGVSPTVGAEAAAFLVSDAAA